MKRFGLILALFTLATQFCTLNAQEKKSYDLATIAFYNLENLFDTIVDPDTSKILQDEFTPKGKKVWNTERYVSKIKNMSSVIAELGKELAQTAPMIVGVSEVENKEVVLDLVNSEALKPYNYGVVHYHSPDKRGIDVALIYRKDFVTIKSSDSRRLYYPEKKDFLTRDQLVVEADLQGESIYVLVNHWPSRRGGEKRSSPLREAAAKLSRSIVDSVNQIHPNAKVIIMGDLNDDPTNKSVKKVLNTSADKNNVTTDQLYNPMEKFYKAGNGTGAYNDTWNLFDQLIITPSLLNSDAKKWKYYKANIYKEAYLIQTTGKYKDYPKRTFSFDEWIDGYSDHFPVYLYLIREK
jgi:exonuclease III